MRGLLPLQAWPMLLFSYTVRLGIENMITADVLIRASLGLKPRQPRPTLELFQNPDKPGWWLLPPKQAELAKVLDLPTMQDVSGMLLLKMGTMAEVDEGEIYLPGASLTQHN